MNCETDGCPFYREVMVSDEAGDVDPEHTCGLDVEIRCWRSDPIAPTTCPLKGSDILVSIEKGHAVWELISRD